MLGKLKEKTERQGKKCKLGMIPKEEINEDNQGETNTELAVLLIILRGAEC